MDKTAKMSNTNKIILTMVVLVIAILGVFLWTQGVGPTPAAAKQPSTVTETGQIIIPVATVSCPNDKNVDGKGRYIDSLSTNKDKVANIVSYLVPVNRKDITRVTLGNTTSSGDGYSTAVNVPCDVDTPITFEPIAATKKWGDIAAYGYQSVVNPKVVAGKSDRLEITYEGKKQDWIKVRVIDNTQPSATESLTNANTTSSNTTFAAIKVDDGSVTGSPTLTGVKIQSATAGTAIAIAADEFLDLTFKFKTNNTKSQFGEDSLRTFFVIDADTSDWAEPVVSGHGITKVKFEDLNVDDASVLSSYEYIYTINPIQETEATINFYIKTASGVNADYDPCILFAPEARYNSIEQLDTVRISVYDDSSTNYLVAFNSATKFCIDIS